MPDLKSATFSSSSRYIGDGNDGQANGDQKNQAQDCGAVEFTVAVTIPNDDKYGTFETRAIVSSATNGKGILYAKTHGQSGRAMELRFKIDCP